MEAIRKPAVAGMFYPVNENELRNEVSLLLDIATNEKKYDNVFGIICPHAGYVYSGKTAAYAYNAIKRKNYKTVIVISPSHYEYFQGSAIYNGNAYQTPLGIVEIDKEMRNELSKNTETIFIAENGHRKEHALEVQLPFLQTVLKKFKLVPIVIGDQRNIFINELALKLAEVVDENTLIVASSDLSHFYNKETADKFDSIVKDNILNFDYQKLQDNLLKENCFACGGGGIVALMKAAEMKGCKKAEVLSRTDSGDVTGDNSSVVGYLSAVIH